MLYYGFELIDKKQPDGKNKKSTGYFELSELVPANIAIKESYNVNTSRTVSFFAMLIAVTIFIGFNVLVFSGQLSKEPVWKLLGGYVVLGLALWYCIGWFIKSFKNPYLFINSNGITFKQKSYSWIEIDNIKCRRVGAEKREDLEIYLKSNTKVYIYLPGQFLNADIGIIVAYINYYWPASVPK